MSDLDGVAVLSEDEVDHLVEGLTADIQGGRGDNLRAAVEMILTVRLAPLVALADEPRAPYPAECDCSHGMGFQFHRWPCRYASEVPKSALRKALAPEARP